MTNNPLKHVHILDTTLRDGSYTIGYQFTANEISLIGKGLELSGVNYIEVGHGLGLGAEREGKGPQAISDLLHMRTCKKSLLKAKFGFFFIPGIGKSSDLKLLKDEGGGFVRVGVDLGNLDESIRIIKEAKLLGLETWANIIKTYAYSVKELKSSSSRLINEGADGLYIVDSAGGMLPSEVANYVFEIKDEVFSANKSAQIGFHGHDNLSLSVASSLAAVEAGCSIVDGSLLGIGRSSGNAATEVLAMVLDRSGYSTGINPWILADLAEKLIRPFLEQRFRQNSIDQALGFAQIHSGLLPLLEKIANDKNIAIRDLVLALAENGRLKISEQEIGKIADSLGQNKIQTQNQARVQVLNKPRLNIYDSNDYKDTNNVTLDSYIDQIQSQSVRMNKHSGLVITGPWQKSLINNIKYQQIRLLTSVVVGAVEINNKDDFAKLLKETDGLVDILFIDKTPREKAWNQMLFSLDTYTWKSLIFPYGDEISILIATCRIIALETQKRKVKKVLISGESSRVEIVKKMLSYWGVCADDSKESEILICVDNATCKEFLSYPNLNLIFDLISGAMQPEILMNSKLKGVKVIRLDGGLALADEVLALFDGSNLLNNIMGKRNFNSIPIVAGGVWGDEGDIIVNNIKEPTQVYGIADGKGGIKRDLHNSDLLKIESARDIINNNFLIDFIKSAKK